MDNYAAHKHKDVKEWLADHPRFVVHFTPAHASWMNLVEVWFGIVERQAIRRGVFKSVKDLNAKIRAFIDGWHDRAHPFVWTKTAEQILAKANRPTTSNPRHKVRFLLVGRQAVRRGVFKSAKCRQRLKPTPCIALELARPKGVNFRPSLTRRTSTPSSAPSSMAGTTAPTRSCGPRPPWRSSRRPIGQRFQVRVARRYVEAEASSQ